MFHLDHCGASDSPWRQHAELFTDKVSKVFHNRETQQHNQLVFMWDTILPDVSSWKLLHFHLISNSVCLKEHSTDISDLKCLFPLCVFFLFLVLFLLFFFLLWISSVFMMPSGSLVVTVNWRHRHINQSAVKLNNKVSQTETNTDQIFTDYSASVCFTSSLKLFIMSSEGSSHLLSLCLKYISLFLD